MARAVFEGTALGLRDVMVCLEEREAGSVSEIRAGGGPMSNSLWTQLKADAIGKPLEVLEFQETGSLGAALLAATGCGLYGSLEEAAGVARRAVPTTIVEPGPGSERMSARFQRYRELYLRTRELMHALAGGAGR
jgi:xylulokinase